MASSTYSLRGGGQDTGPARYGTRELSRELEAAGCVPGNREVDYRIDLSVSGSSGEPAESYQIRRAAGESRGGHIEVIGSDETGLMYGCLDLAEQIAMSGSLEALEERNAAPFLPVRGVYTFLHDPAADRATMGDCGYWPSYAQRLARWRYNRFNLIYGHQTAYLIPIYTHLLDDLDDDFPGIRADGLTSADRAANLQNLRAASAAMADHGIAFFLGIWNSRPWKVENGVWETQPTHVRGTDDLALLTEYTRRGFLRLMELCPAIRGIQLRMNIESGVADQRYYVQSYVPALKELAAGGRRLTVELRNWGLHPDTVEAFRTSGVEIVVSTKYFAEHQGMPYQPPLQRGSYSYDSFLRVDKPFPFQWHLWNLGSHRLFSWGDPEYGRRFARSCRLGDGVGFEITPPGSQKGYSQWGEVPADWSPREDLPTMPDHERYWFFHQVFGRTGYDPQTSDAAFIHEISTRTSAAAAPAVFAVYRAASGVVSYLISMRMDDPNMYVWPELDCGGPIDHDLGAPVGEASLFATPLESARARLARSGDARIGPEAAAQYLERAASSIEAAVEAAQALPGLEGFEEWRAVRTDAMALAALARYHASKRRSGGSLALFYATGECRFHDEAVAAAEYCVELWQELCVRTEAYCGKLHYGPSGGHWRDNIARVRYDLDRVRRAGEIFGDYGLFERGFDMGALVTDPPVSPRFASGLECEPRFVGVGAASAYRAGTGYGWLQTGGLQAQGPAPLSRDLVWGVHYIRPGEEYDPQAASSVPLESLRLRYLTADFSRVFRVDLPDGEYEVTAVAPAHTSLVTPIVAGEERCVLDASNGRSSLRFQVTGGSLSVTVGGEGRWALSALIVRSVGPTIAHLPAFAVDAGAGLVVTATATAPSGVDEVTLEYEIAGDRRTRCLDGPAPSFRADVRPAEFDPPGCDAIEYRLRARAADGREASAGPFRIPVVRDFTAPRIVSCAGPEHWSRSEPFAVTVELEHPHHARAVRLHVREADQNRVFRRVELQPQGSSRCELSVDTQLLDQSYDLIYYVELVDCCGGGSFWPAPLADRRYVVCGSAAKVEPRIR